MSEKFWGAIIFIMMLNPGRAQQIEEGAAWKQSAGFRPVLLAGLAGGRLWLAGASMDKNDGVIRDLQLEELDTATLGVLGAFTFTGLFTDRQQFYPEGVFAWMDTLRIFGSSYDKSGKTNRLLMRNLNSNGKLEPVREIFSCPTAGYTHNRKRFGINLSADEQKLVCWSLHQTADSLLIAYQVFGAGFQPLKRYQLRQRSDAPVRIDQGLLDNYGNFHVLMSQEIEQLQQGRRYTLYAFPVMSEEVVAYQIELPDKRISSIAMQVADDDYLIAAGYYADLFRQEEELNGFFFLRINRETGDIPVKEVRQMGQEFFNLYAGDEMKPARKDMGHLKLRSILPLSGGACLLVAEQEWREERCDTDVRTGQRICDTYYFSGNVMLQHFSATGAMDWLQFIRKQQQSVADEGAYASMIQQQNQKHTTFYFNQAQSQPKPEKKGFSLLGTNALAYFRLELNGQGENGLSRNAGCFYIIPATAKSEKRALYFIGEKEGFNKLFKSERQP